MKEELQPWTKDLFDQQKKLCEQAGYKVLTRWRPGLRSIRLGDIVLGPRKRCKCNNADPLICHECEESTGVCYCVCHAGFKRGKSNVRRKVQT